MNKVINSENRFTAKRKPKARYTEPKPLSQQLKPKNIIQFHAEFCAVSEGKNIYGNTELTIRVGRTTADNFAKASRPEIYGVNFNLEAKYGEFTKTPYIVKSIDNGYITFAQCDEEGLIQKDAIYLRLKQSELNVALAITPQKPASVTTLHVPPP